ncbi:hypothetical protein D7V86_08190 [bacterium D16-51]|nr:hypothetical protein D7V96_08175 [bacterium D16-59]RKI60578.1 hypothetical protein D7V86_08190 [bacterium D16-51]
MQLVLNELSVEFPLEDEYEGKRVMTRFLCTYRLIKKILKNDRILLDTNYNGIYLASGYNISKWRNDPSVDMDEKRLFRSLINRSLVYHKEDVEEEEVHIDGQDSKGALLAYLNEDCLISFDTNNKWKTDTIYAKLLWLGEEDVEEKYIKLPNIVDEDTVCSFEQKYFDKLADDLREKIVVGEDILKNAAQVFSSLIFCRTAERQLRQLKDPVSVRQICKRLLELQEYFAARPKVFDKNQLNHATPESDITLQYYSREHTFQLPDGQYQVFSWHMRFTGNMAGRIFFFPDIQNSKCYIGHIGGKLKTVTYG